MIELNYIKPIPEHSNTALYGPYIKHIFVLSTNQQMTSMFLIELRIYTIIATHKNNVHERQLSIKNVRHTFPIENDTHMERFTHCGQHILDNRRRPIS